MLGRSGRKPLAGREPLLRRLLGAGIAAVLGLAGSQAAAQHITVDGRLSPAQTLAGPNYAIGANLGQQKGGNLFQSFGAFGLSQGETATFSGPASVTNVIGRVTGGAVSSVNGTIQSTIPGATVYLINPAGVVFGPSGGVNVSGGFHASSADYLRMSDGSRFQATNPNASTLTVAPPAAFGFLSANPAPVTVTNSTLGPVAGTLGIVGGPVTISGATLSAPGGVRITSVAGMGEVPVAPRGGPPPTVTSYGAINVSGSTIAVNGATGTGSIRVRGGAITISATTINADSQSSGPGGNITLRGDSGVAITKGSDVHAVTKSAGQGGDVTVRAASGGQVLVDGASLVAVGGTSTGNGGGL